MEPILGAAAKTLPRRAVLATSTNEFLMLGAAKISRRRPALGMGVPPVAPTRAEAIQWHMEARLANQMRVMVYGLLEALRRPAGSPVIFSASPAFVQRAKGGEARGKASWATELVGAHHARTQPLLNQELLQAVVPATVAPLLEFDLADVTMHVRAANDLDRILDDRMIPLLLGLMNAMAGIRHDVTPERIIGNNQYMIRSELAAMLTAQAETDKALVSAVKRKDTTEEERLVLRTELLKEQYPVVEDFNVAAGVAEFIAFAESLFASAEPSKDLT